MDKGTKTHTQTSTKLQQLSNKAEVCLSVCVLCPTRTGVCTVKTGVRLWPIRAFLWFVQWICRAGVSACWRASLRMSHLDRWGRRVSVHPCRLNLLCVPLHHVFMCLLCFPGSVGSRQPVCFLCRLVPRALQTRTQVLFQPQVRSESQTVVVLLLLWVTLWLSDLRYSSLVWMETVVSSSRLSIKQCYALCLLWPSDLCMSSIWSRVSVWGQPVRVLSQAESRRRHADLPAGPSVWTSQPVPQSAAGRPDCLSVRPSCYQCCVNGLIPPQLDLDSGKTSTLLDVVNRPQAGTSQAGTLASIFASIVSTRSC